MKRNLKTSKPIRILIVDDHAMVRDGLTAILEFKSEFQVVGEADGGTVAITQAAKHKPDIVLLDLMMPDLDGASATRKIKEASPDSKILILTTYGDSSDLNLAFENGASGAITKTLSKNDLFDAILRTAAGEEVLSEDIKASLNANAGGLQPTKRQLEILSRAARGFTNEEIARQFGISLSSVKFHLGAIYQRLGVTGRAEAITCALSKQLIKV